MRSRSFGGFARVRASSQSFDVCLNASHFKRMQHQHDRCHHSQAVLAFKPAQSGGVLKICSCGGLENKTSGTQSCIVSFWASICLAKRQHGSSNKLKRNFLSRLAGELVSVDADLNLAKLVNCIEICSSSFFFLPPQHPNPLQRRRGTTPRWAC